MKAEERPELVFRPPENCVDLLTDPDAVHSSFTRDADARPLYRVVGFSDAFRCARTANIKDVVRNFNNPGIALDGRRIILEEVRWSTQQPFRWQEPISYQLVLNIVQSGKPVQYSKAVQCIAAFDATARERKGDDLYPFVGILACSYNIDDFGDLTVQALDDAARSKRVPLVYEYAEQRLGAKKAAVLKDLAGGKCATKVTTNQLQALVKTYLDEYGIHGVSIGAVRPGPGSKVGKKGASLFEEVDVHLPRSKFVNGAA